jgi:hypothetical protein
MPIPRRANDNFVHPEHAFAAQSIIRKRFGFYDRDVLGMSGCAIKILSALRAQDRYFYSEESTQEQIEWALRSLAEEFAEYGIERFSEDAVTRV